MELPFQLLQIICIIIIIYLLIGLIFLTWKIVSYVKEKQQNKNNLDASQSQETGKELLNQNNNLEVDIVDMRSKDNEQKLEDKITTPQEVAALNENQNENENNNENEAFVIDALDESEGTKEFKIYFYLRYNVLNNIIGITILYVLGFPGPDEGGFDEIMLKLWDIPKRSKTYKTKWKPFDNARFDLHATFLNIKPDEINKTSLRFRIYARKKYTMAKLIAESNLSLNGINFASSLSDIQNFIKITLKSPFN